MWEPIRDEEGIKGLKARWIGDPGENAIEINTPFGSTDIKTGGNAAPTIEYVQDGENRTVAVKHIKDLSCELSQETVDRIATPRGAALAICLGAGAGLFGWFLISAAARPIRSTRSTNRRYNLSALLPMQITSTRKITPPKKLKITAVDPFYLRMPNITTAADGTQDTLLVPSSHGYGA